MKKRHRWLGLTKWAMTLALALTLSAYVASGWYGLFWHPLLRAAIGISDGSAWIGWHHNVPPGFTQRIHESILRSAVFRAGNFGILERPPNFRPLFTFSFDFETWQVLNDANATITQTVIPLWAPSALLLLLTAALWWLDRRRVRPGHCRSCRYDLTGNVTGICPECGAPASGRRLAPPPGNAAK